jgi:hypothetical protein
MSPEQEDAYYDFYFSLSDGEKDLYDSLPFFVQRRIGSSYAAFLRATDGMPLPPPRPTGRDDIVVGGINDRLDDDELDFDDVPGMYAGEQEQEHEEWEEEEREQPSALELEGFDEISASEYFSGVLDAIPTMEIDSVKHMRHISNAAHKIAVERGDSDIAEGYADIAAVAEGRIADEYGVDSVGELSASDLEAECVLQTKDVSEDTVSTTDLRNDLLKNLADEHDPSAVLGKFRVESKRWKKYTLPRFSKDANIPNVYDYRTILEDHDHLTYFYAITKHMAHFSAYGKTAVAGGRDGNRNVSKEFGEYVKVLSGGMQVALKNQLRNWQSGIKFLVMRGVASMYGPEYGRNGGSVKKTAQILNKFVKGFTKVTKAHIALEKAIIDYTSKDWMNTDAGKEDSDRAEKAKNMRDAVLAHARDKVAPFWTSLVLFSLGQSKASMESPVGKMILESFSKAWETHTDKTIAFIKTLTTYGFQKDPVQLKNGVDAMFEDGKDLGALINAYVYGMVGEPIPTKVVRRLFAVVEM